MPIGVVLRDGYGNLGPLFPDRIARIVYQREVKYSDTDFASSSPGVRNFVFSIPQMDTTKGFFTTFRNLPDGDNRWWRPSYIQNTANPNIYAIGLSAADGTWNNATKQYSITMGSGLYANGGTPVLTILGFRFS